MNSSDFELMLNWIARKCALSEINYKELRRLGVNPIDWPDVASRLPSIEFFATVECLNYRAAQGSHGRHLLAFKYEELSFEHISLFYNPEIKKLKYSKLAYAILENPALGDRFLHDFKNNQNDSLELRVFSENISSTIENHMRSVKSKESFKILPDFPKLSKSIGGFNGGRVTIISAQTGFGKTKLAVNIADSASKIIPTIFFNMEMSFDDFSGLIIQKKARIRNHDWYDGSFITDYNLNEILKISDEKTMGLKLSDGRALTCDEIISTIYSEAENGPIFIIVDYDQKVKLKRGQDEWMGVLKFVEELEEVAKATGSHVLLLAQANDLGNLKSSARAQQPASSVLNFCKNESGITVIRSLKNRFGPKFCLEVDYDASMSIVKEMDFINETPIAKKTHREFSF
jgi:hypothetical protein